MSETGFVDALRAHDDAVRRTSLDLWVGGEPTFTRAESTAPCWNTEAEGGDKEATARAWLTAFANEFREVVRYEPVRAPVLLRAAGRQYPGETEPRFAFGAGWRRDGKAPCLLGSLEGLPTPAPAQDPELCWLTATPDPGVLEINMAPCPSVTELYSQLGAIWRASEACGLSARRFRYNGEITDSGGGGQITFGGRAAAQSPFFVHPRLLPSLVRYLNRHPALSYAFASECVGTASQGPRPDEGSRERFEELGLALDALQDRGACSPDRLWRTLAPLLVDLSGNAHRAELNIEKLHNPGLLDRGCQGLVEFRALRMMPTPESQAAVAALLRAVVARCAASEVRDPLIDFGAALHDHRALPAFLEADLQAVLEDLEAHGLGLRPALTAHLDRRLELLTVLTIGDSRLSLTPAVEFWPLVDDVASQERSGARLVDASLRRLELRVDGPAAGRVSVNGVIIPLTPMGSGSAIGAVRYRAFVPSPGFSPDVAADDPLTVVWEAHDPRRAVRVHAWRPDGGAYAALPTSPGEAAARRLERVVPVEPPVLEPRHAACRLAPPAGAPQLLTVDLRGRSPT